MKKALALIAFGAITSASFASVVYDSLYSDLGQTTLRTLTNTGSTPRGKKGDIVTLAPLTGTNTFYNMTSMVCTLNNNSTTTFNGPIDVNIKLYKTATPGDFTSTTTPVFTDQFYNGTVSLSNLTLNSGFATILTITFGSLGVDLVPTSLSAPTFGVELTTLVGGVANNDVSPGLTSMPTSTPLTVGSSTNGWYRDANGDGTLQQAEARVFAGVDSNLALVINANAVPEPAALAVMSLGIVGLVARRRRSSK